MPRPKNKEELLTISEKQFVTLWKQIHLFTEEEQEMLFTFEDRDKNIRDVLTHLYEWHQLLLQWIYTNTHGETTSFLPAPYNWKTYPKMNEQLWEKHQSTSYHSAITLCKNSHQEVMKQISLFSNEELFIKKYFNWTGNTSLGSYCISVTSSHYDWAIKKIRKQYKSLS